VIISDYRKNLNILSEKDGERRKRKKGKTYFSQLTYSVVFQYLYRDNPSAARSSRALMEKVRIRAKPTPSNEDNAGGRTPLACGNSEMPPPPVPTVSIAELNASLFSSLDEGGEVPYFMFHYHSERDVKNLL
jgi:hypothetical protein